MILFISDLHLDTSRPKIAEAFFHFLQNDAAKAEALYILGDLFELWVGDDDDDPFVQTVQQHIAGLHTTTSVYFMRGNRDFLIGEQFADNAKAILLDDPTCLNIGEQQVLLMHGDSLCTKDEAYQAFRAQSRSQEWRDMVLSKSLDERRELGRQLRQQSKTMSSRKASDIMDVTDNAVIETLKSYQASLLIHGHTHRPDRHHLQFGGTSAERIVLGDWDTQAWCLRFDGSWSLDSWPI